MPLIVAFGAFVLIFFAAQMGSRAGALPALGGMLGTLLGMGAGLRYWFVLSRWLAEHESTWAPLHAVIVFWAIFLCVTFITIKLRVNYTDAFEFVLPSLVGRLLGGLFGLVGGLVFATAVAMTLSLVSPQFLPAYRPSELPLSLDRWPLTAYRYVETRIAGIPSTDPGHTRLPALKDKPANSPADFWQ